MFYATCPVVQSSPSEDHRSGRACLCMSFEQLSYFACFLHLCMYTSSKNVCVCVCVCVSGKGDILLQVTIFF